MLANLLKLFKIEDPRRIHEFKAKIQNLKWEDKENLNSLNVIFNAVDTLAEAEVHYYYRRRGTRASISTVCRFFAWLLGSIGLLIPLLAATETEFGKACGPFGYSALALSASLLAANALFGGTEGHVRFVSTQLQIERLITESRVSWCAYQATFDGTIGDIQKGFVIIHGYAQKLHETTISETGNWGESSLNELSKFQAKIKKTS